MSKAVKHLTWGEEVRELVPGTDREGLPLHITLAVWKTLCKRLIDDAELPPNPAPLQRPEGFCKRCWNQLLKDKIDEPNET